MNQIQTLTEALCELIRAIEGHSIKLIVGGGFGIYLKVKHVREDQVRTLIDQGFWPEARSTNDLDLFLRPELLVDSARLEPLSRAIYELGYKVVPTASKYQFVKAAGQDSAIKIDILTGPRAAFTGSGLHVDARRVRPKPSVDLHAHPVDEASTLEKNLLTVRVAGKLDSGEEVHEEVFLPHPFTFAMMKLFAFRDQATIEMDESKAQYHALDTYSIVATATEAEWEQALKLRDEFRNHPTMAEASKIVRDCFSEPDHIGLIRLRESRYYREDFRIPEFTDALKELFT